LAVTTILTVLSLGGLVDAAPAQTERPRSETGRHRLPSAVGVSPNDSSRVVAANSRSGWFVGLGAGLTGGGDLWRVATANDVSIPWESAVPFTSSRFNATLSNNFGAGIMVGRQLGDMWSLRLDLNSARMDVTAEAPQGQQAGVFGYDRLTMTILGLTGEVKLARVPSAPYASVGVIINSISAAREVELDQTQVGYRIGLGYLHALVPGVGLRAEARYSRTGFDAGSFVPQSTFPTQPEVEFVPAGDLNIFELILAVQMNL